MRSLQYQRGKLPALGQEKPHIHTRHVYQEKGRRIVSPYVTVQWKGKVIALQGPANPRNRLFQLEIQRFQQRVMSDATRSH